MSDNTMNIAGEMSAIAASNGIYTLADSALRLSTESLSAAIDNKVTIDNRLCNVVEQTDLSIVKLSASEYYDLVNSDAVISNVVYVVENQFENAYGQQIKNLAPGTDLSDAVNLEQLSNALSDVVIPTDLSAFTNSPGYTTNAGTITGITMNGASKGTAGNVDLGTVLTAHQSLSNCLQNNSSYDNINLTATNGIRLASNVRIDNGYGFTVKDDAQDSYTIVNLTGIGVKEQIENESDDQTNIGAAYITMSTLRPIQLPPSELFKSIIFTTKTFKTSQTSSLANLIYTKSETSSASEITNALSDIKISYDSDERKLVLSAGSSTTSVDCNDFIKDGMLSTVELDGKQLVFNFNTDAGMQPISVALSNFIDETQYWKKSETSSATEISTALDSKADANAYLPLSGGTMSGDITLGKDNQIVFGRNEDGTVVFKDPSEADFGIYLSAEEDGEPAYQSKYIFSDTYSGFNVVEPIEEDVAVIRSGDLYAALSSKAELNDIPSQVSQLENDAGYLTAHQSLSDYYAKSETSSAAEISTAFQLSAGNKVFVDDRISNISEQTDLSVIKLSSDEYGQIIDDVLSNAIYIVEDSYNNAFGAQMKNLAPGTDLSDAVNLEQLNAVSSSVPTKVSQLANDAGYTTNTGTITGITMNGTSKGTSGVVNLGTVLTAHQSLANYYTKSETSSANEISTALENAGGGSSRYALVTAQLVSDGGSLTCTVDDQTITTIQVSSSATPIVVQLPVQPEDGARDFILRIEISSSAAPTFTFNGVNETIDFDSEDDDWAVMEPGLNLVSFTETKRGGGSDMNQGGNTPTYCTVTFDIENGQYASKVNVTFADPADATRQVEAGQPVGTLPTLNYVSPTYAFQGWYTIPIGDNQYQVTDQTVITNDTTFYAIFYIAGLED